MQHCIAHSIAWHSTVCPPPLPGQPALPGQPSPGALLWRRGAIGGEVGQRLDVPPVRLDELVQRKVALVLAVEGGLAGGILLNPRRQLWVGGWAMGGAQ